MKSKQKTSMNSIVKFYDNIYRVGYCNLQCLLSHLEPRFYNAGVYGWNCDIYLIYANNKQYTITTGYRNMKGKSIDYKLIEKYETLAKEITENYYDGISWDEKRTKLDNLISEFFKEIEASQK